MHQTSTRLCSFIGHMEHYVETYRYSGNFTILPYFKHDFKMFIVKFYQGIN